MSPINDITKDNLPISPEEVSAALMDMGDGFMVFDREWRFGFVNYQAARRGATTPSELLGKRVWELYPGLLNTTVHQKYQQVMETRQPQTFEFEGQQSHQWYEIRVYAVDVGIAVYWLDITETRQARLERERLVSELENARRQLETEHARLEAVLQQMPSGVIIADNTGEVILSNQQASAILRAATDPVENSQSGTGFKEFHLNGNQIFPKEWPLARSLQSGEVIRGEEVEVRYADGNTATIRVNSAPIRLEGQEIAAVAILDNITAQKEAERHLQVSEERERSRAVELNAVMDAVPAIIWVTHDSSCQEVAGNRAAYEIFQVEAGSNLSLSYQKEQAAFKFRVLRKGVEIQTEDLPLQYTARTGKPLRNYEEDIVYNDGTTLHLFGNVSPLLDEDGHPAGAVAAFMDITKRVQTEMALQQSEQRLRLAITSVPVFLYTMDRDLRITWQANLPRPYQPSDVLNQRVDNLFAQPEAGEMIAAKRAVIETGQGAQIQSSVFLEGERRYFILTMEPIFNESGAVSGLTAAVVDITRQRQVEDERREYLTNMEVQRRLMEYRERERQEIARDIHDGPIQNLSSTIFNIQFARDAIKDQVARLEMEQIGLSIKASVRELREIVNSLRPPSLIRFGLSRAIQVHAEDFQEKQPQIHLNLDLATQDENLTEQLSLTFFRIYQEALNNVVRHADASEVWVRYNLDDNEMSLEVEDNGKGFDLPSNFVDQTITGHYGLAGMNERTIAVGGKLIVDSVKGRGTRIRATAPVQRKI